MTAVAKIEQQAPVPFDETTALISMIERAARDPQVDIDKMERLVAMQERSMARASEQAFNDAMAKAQGDMRRVATDSTNPQTRSKYASYAALDKAMRPIYTTHGFALSFGTAEGAPADYVRIVCDVSNSGYTRKYQVDMPADGKGAKGGDVMTKTHAVGSAMSYGQRYLLKMIFNIAIGDDDDGNAAGSGEKITQDQAGTLQALITEVGADKKKFLVYITGNQTADRLTEIPAAKFKDAVAALQAKGAKS